MYVARHPRQEASLFGGSLRRNLDPFNRYPDALLWSALDTVQLKVKVEHLPGKLYAEMIDFGNNFSLGERYGHAFFFRRNSLYRYKLFRQKKNVGKMRR